MKINKQFIAWVVVLVAVVIAAALGVQYPLPAPPAPVAIQVMDTSRGVAQNAPYYNPGNRTMYFPAGTFINMTNDLTTRNITSTGTLSLAALAWGVAATVADGGTITHNIASAPTACVVSASGGITVSIKAVSAISMTVNVPSTATAIYWFCGK